MTNQISGYMEMGRGNKEGQAGEIIEGTRNFRDDNYPDCNYGFTGMYMSSSLNFTLKMGRKI